MSIHAPIPHQRSIEPLTLTGWTPGCGRTELHMCRVNSVDMLDASWQFIRSRVLILREKNPPRSMWEPEHVLSEIMKGLQGQTKLECFLAHENETVDQLHGFIIVHPKQDMWNFIPYTLYVWLLQLDPHIMLRLMPEFEDMARKRHYRRWEWLTSRDGWERRASLFGAKVVEQVICKELYDEE